MKAFKPQESDFTEMVLDGKRRKVLSRKVFDTFNAWLLDLGDLSRGSPPLDAVAAVFEMDGFHEFCKRADSHTVIPSLLREFLIWVVDRIRLEIKRKEHSVGILLWSPLPIFVKYTGEGVLVIWDMSAESDVTRRNVLACALAVCSSYRTDFLPRLFGRVADPPAALRCALARGSIYALGDGNDYTGSCILMAQRLLRLYGVNYCFDSRGFHLKDVAENDWLKRDAVVKRVTLHGIGVEEQIAILRSEFKAMSMAERRQFKSL